LRIPKKYGQSKANFCPFCEQQAIIANKQKLPVCIKHKNTLLQEIRCLCGSYLDIKEGKFGPFFTCINCGIINMRKALELAQVPR